MANSVGAHQVHGRATTGIHLPVSNAVAVSWTACPDPMGSECGWDCNEGPTVVSLAGTRLVRLEYQQWLDWPTGGSLIELMVSASDLPAAPATREAPTCLTLLFSSRPQTSEHLVPDLFWAQTWLDWFADALPNSDDRAAKYHKILAEVPNADEAFCHRWLSLVRALCDERSLEFSVLGNEKPTSYNSYLAKPRKGCCRLPSGIRRS